MNETTAEKIERLLRERLNLSHFELVDDSARHAGHPGATSGGGHYNVVLVSNAFEGLGRLQRHRLVYEALDGMIGTDIHALSMRVLVPSEWRPVD